MLLSYSRVKVMWVLLNENNIIYQRYRLEIICFNRLELDKNKYLMTGVWQKGVFNEVLNREP